MNKTCFVIMPFAEENKQVYDYAIEPAVKYFGYRCVRADDPSGPRNIVKNIIEYLYFSDFIIADITDFNPNVFYELGISHCMGNKTIIICNEKCKPLPFDLSNYHIIFYQEDIRGIQNALQEKLKKEITEFNSWVNKPNNPVQDFLPNFNINNSSNFHIYMAGEDIKYGNAVILKSDEKVYKAKAHSSDIGTVIGIVVEDAHLGFPCKVQKSNLLKIDKIVFKAGDTIYLRSNNNGINISPIQLKKSTENEDKMQIVGIGHIDSYIDIKISTTYLTLK